jgi:hypothetical protein
MPRTISTVVDLSLVGTSAAAISAVTLSASLLSAHATPLDLRELPASVRPADQPRGNPPLQRLAQTQTDSWWSRAVQATQPNLAQDPRRLPARTESRQNRTAIPLPRPVPLALRGAESASASAFALAPAEMPSAVSGTRLAQGPALSEATPAATGAIEPPRQMVDVPAPPSAPILPTTGVVQPSIPAVTPPGEAPQQDRSAAPGEIPGVLTVQAPVPPTTAAPEQPSATTTTEPPLPRSRNGASADASTSYSDRVAGYWNGAVGYVSDGLGSLAGYMPNWPLSWSGSDGLIREQLLVDAMTAAGYGLFSLTREGTLVTTVTYTFRKQRTPSSSERLMAAKVAADLATVSGGPRGYFEQSMIKSALEENDASPVSIQTFELQTRPYPSLRSVAAPKPTTR